MYKHFCFQLWYGSCSFWKICFHEKIHVLHLSLASYYVLTLWGMLWLYFVHFENMRYILTFKTMQQILTLVGPSQLLGAASSLARLCGRRERVSYQRWSNKYNKLSKSNKKRSKLNKTTFSWNKIFEKLHRPHQSWKDHFLNTF